MNNGTNNKLITAYAKLQKKDIKHINVSMLCEKADVSRAGFYIYYKDMTDFIGKLHDYIITLIFRQATELLRCADKELKNAVKKENLLLNEDEIVILRYMTSGSKYFEFALHADLYYDYNRSQSLLSEDLWEKYRDEIDIFSRGYFPILILGLTNYNENTFYEDIKNCRVFFRFLCEYIAGSDVK